METIREANEEAIEKVAAEVRAALARRKIAVNRLPDHLGKSQSYWDRRTSGKIAFNVVDLTLLAELTGTSVKAFFGQEHSGYWSENALIGSMSTVGLDRHFDRRAA